MIKMNNMVIAGLLMNRNFFVQLKNIGLFILAISIFIYLLYSIILISIKINNRYKSTNKDPKRLRNKISTKKVITNFYFVILISVLFSIFLILWKNDYDISYETYKSAEELYYDGQYLEAYKLLKKWYVSSDYDIYNDYKLLEYLVELRIKEVYMKGKEVIENDK